MKSWIQAGRPLAHVNIAVPLLLGQVAAWHVTGRFSWPWFAAAMLWGVLDHLFVIFANDFADHETDSGRRTLLSGGSGVIPEGKLTALQVGRAARTAAILLIVYSCALAFLGRVWTPLYGLAAASCFRASEWASGSLHSATTCKPRARSRRDGSLRPLCCSVCAAMS